MKDSVYKKSFDLFLKKTDEKHVLMRFIKDNIKPQRGMSFLDIGGGDGTLALFVAKETKRAVVIEPNKQFFEKLKRFENIKAINAKWEKVNLKDKFDFILAAYVVTYFPSEKRRGLLKKMYDYLQPGGKLLILSVDSEKGSWREIHTYFYNLIGHKHQSSDEKLKKLLKPYEVRSKVIKTHVSAKNEAEMLEMLVFDFKKYPKEFKRYKKDLEYFLSCHQIGKRGIALEMIHNAYIITKNK